MISRPIAWGGLWCVVGAALLSSSCPDPKSTRAVVHVAAASSLTEAFTALERRFEARHPGVDVQLSFAGSQVLKLQIQQGAPVDVFASANPSDVEELVEGGLISRSHVFAYNELVLIVPRSNPARLQTFADLPRAERVVLGTEDVPVGAYAREALARAATIEGQAFVDQVRAHVVSEESNVRLARSKVELGEADAAFVYRTDAAVTDRVTTIELPDAANVRGAYVVGVVEGSDAQRLASELVRFLRAPEAQRLLREHGFRTP